MYSHITIITPVGSVDLTTLQHVKDDLGITSVDAARDAIISRYITECSTVLANACGRVFGEQVVSEKFRLEEAKPVLIVTHRPITTLTSVTEDDDAALMLATEVEAKMEAGLLRRLDGDDGASGWYTKRVTVAYTSGYDLPSEAPVDLQKACRAMVKAQWISKGRDPLIKSENVPGVYEVAYWVGGLPGGATWPIEIQAAITAHKDWSA